MKSPSQQATLLAAFAGLLGVALGAFGAHGLKDLLVSHGTLAVWQTAVLYQLVHAVALLGVAGWRSSSGQGLHHIKGVAWIWAAGILFFSGSLFLLALGGPAWLGPVTPLGGLAFLVGWGLVAASALRKEAV